MGEKDYPTLHWQDLLKRVAGPRPGKRIVEIGAFRGEDTRKLEELGVEVIAVDIEADYLKTARKERGIRHPVAADMKALSLANGSADTVFHSNSITPPFASTDEEVRCTIKEVSRVAREKVIICTDYLPTTKQPRGKIAFSHTPEGLRRAVESSGLHIHREEVVKIPEKFWVPRAPSEGYLVIEAVKAKKNNS